MNRVNSRNGLTLLLVLTYQSLPARLACSLRFSYNVGPYRQYWHYWVAILGKLSTHIAARVFSAPRHWAGIKREYSDWTDLTA